MNAPGHKPLSPFQDTIHPCRATCGHHSHRLHHLEATGVIWTRLWEGRHHGRRQDRQLRSILRFPCRPRLLTYTLLRETHRIFLRPYGRTISLTSYFLKVQACPFSHKSLPRRHTKIWTQTSCNSNKCIIKDSSSSSSSRVSRRMCPVCMGNINSNKDNKDSKASQMANITVLCSSTRPPSRQALLASLGPTVRNHQEAKVQVAIHGLLISKGFRKARAQTRGVQEALVVLRCRAR